MIRRHWGKDKWMLITQAEHARLAGVVAAAWQFAPVRPHPEVLRAISFHDDGWAEFDAQPSITPDGEPCSFLEVPRSQRYAIWSRSSERLSEKGMLYGACVVAQYFLNRARREAEDLAKFSPRDAIALGNFLSEQDRRIKKWRAELEKRAAAEAPAEMPSNPNDSTSQFLASVPEGGSFEEEVRLLEVCDQISVLLCTDFRGSTQIDNVPYLNGVSKITVSSPPNGKVGLIVDPLPFRKNLRDHIRAVIIPIKKYESDEELRETIRSCSPVSQEFLLSASTETASVG